MLPKMLASALFCGLAVSVSAQSPPDIVAEAARAIIAQDAEALENARFTSRGFDSKRIPVAAFLARIEGCSKIAEYKRGEVSMAHEIHYNCPNKPNTPIKCITDTLVVAIDRATSPDVTAYLRYQPLDTPECKSPELPAPSKLGVSAPPP